MKLNSDYDKSTNDNNATSNDSFEGSAQFKNSLSVNATTVTYNILNIMKAYNRRPDDSLGHDHQDMSGFKDKVENIVSSGKPINFVIPFCSFKLHHPDRTLMEGPDYAEYKAIQRIGDFCKDVGQHYPVHFTLFHDAAVAQPLGITPSLDAMDVYTGAIGEMVSEVNLTLPKGSAILQQSIVPLLEKRYPDKKFGAEMLETAMTNYNISTVEALTHKAKTTSFADIHTRNKAWLKKNIPDINSLTGTTDKQRKKGISELAYKKQRAVDLFRCVLDEEMPETTTLRASPHMQASGESHKFGFEFYPNSREPGRMPWTGVYVDNKDGTCNMLCTIDVKNNPNYERVDTRHGAYFSFKGP